MPFELFSPRMQELIQKKGFPKPTEPQRLGIPEILQGNNVLVVASTGIGKTETAMLPLLDLIYTKKMPPIALMYITPLKSLNRDLLDRLFWWADKLDIDIAVRHGDTSQQERTSQREAPPHVLISTPETLGAILTGSKMRAHLKQVKYVVIDEIHELIESKRGTQLSLLLERLRMVCGSFQIVGLSATVGTIDLAAHFLGNDVHVIETESQKQYDVKVEFPKPALQDVATSEELSVGSTTMARLRRLYELITSHDSVIAFTNTRETAEVLSSRLRTWNKELKQDVHHGSLSKEHRIKSEQKFKDKELRSLIATSSLELGIDIGAVDLVVQYLSPRRVTKCIQRVGRAGHTFWKTSKGVILSGDEDLFESAVIAKRTHEKALEKTKVHDHALDVLAHQILGLLLDQFEWTPAALYAIVSKSYLYRNLSRKEFDGILDFLAQLRLISITEKQDGSKVVNRRRRAWIQYFDHLSTIPPNAQYLVVSMIQNEPVGQLDEEFVAEHAQSGAKFICSGRAWKVIQIIGRKVMVEPIEDIESSIPAWEGELIPVDFHVAQDVGTLRAYVKNHLNAPDLVGTLEETYHVNRAAAEELIRLVFEHCKGHILPTDKTLLCETYKDFIILHTCAGSLVNATLAKYLGGKLTNELGVTVNIKTDPYRIMLQTVAKPQMIEKMLQGSEDIDTLWLDMERSSLFKHRFLQVARRFGILAKNAPIERINLNKIVKIYEHSPAYKETVRELSVDKLDIETTKKFLEQLWNGDVTIVHETGLSLFGEMGLVEQFSEVMRPRLPEKEIFSAFTRRLMKTRMRLVCLNCASYSVVQTVDEVAEQPECPKCGSRLMGISHPMRHHVATLLVKKHAGKPLTEEEKKELKTLERTADLTIVYGKRAVICLAGHGIGPQTAARILSNLHATQEALCKDILKAEKQFIKTKPYWN